ncbi:phage tail tip lysozyme [Streptococcus ferus]|uniref:phage tail tip lysozyme n=1 Tax=Streptococcus ferus TaxID=1345 RepID=UPI003515C9F8
MRKKVKIAGCLVLLMPFLFFMFLLFLVAGGGLEDGSCSVVGSSETSTSVQTDSSAAADSDWTKPGTTAYKTAEKVFKAFVNHGTSGAFASGIVGWVNSEGGFAMIGRAEGHYGNDLKTNSIAYGVVPSGLAYYTTAAGGGIFQFTPYTKYAPLGSPDWEDADKMIAFVIKAVASGDWNASMDLTGKSHSFQEAVKLTDPQEATLTWQAYERGSVAHINQAQKKADAQKAYEVFNGAKYKYDEAKFKKAFGQSSDNISTTDSASDSASSQGCGGSDSNSVGNGDYAHIFDEPYQVLQPYGFTPWSMGAGAALYASSGGKHTGVDVATLNVSDSKDVPVYSMTDGTVYSVSYSGLGGHAITIQPEGTQDYLYYGHLKYAPTFKSGEKVKKGQKIAVLGHSGDTNIYHVHLEYSTNPRMATGQYDKDPSFLFQKSDTLKQNQIINPKETKDGKK